MKETIHIQGARTHNLKDVTIDIPRGKFVVITGLSGSGKSSLAFDTLYAEGQRRYVESLSAYARQFLGRMQKPDVDYIIGIPPAIAISQRVSSRNPRSTVGTSTEIYDYLKLLFARIGTTISPVSGQEVRRHHVKDVVDYLNSQPKGTRIMLLSPVRLDFEGNSNAIQTAFEQRLKLWQSQGFTRLYLSGETIRINDERWATSEWQSAKDALYLLIDRVVADGERATANRFADSVQTAFFEGKGECRVIRSDEVTHTEEHKDFSERFEADGITFIEPTEHLFDFNSPLGACPTCGGFGNTIGIDPDLVVPDKTKSIYEEAIACWRGEKMGLWNKELIRHASLFDFPIHKPFYELTPQQRQLIWSGNEYFHGLHDFFKMLEKEQYQKIQYRVMLSRYRGKTICPECGGLRLRKEASYVQVGGKSIQELVSMPVSELEPWFLSLPSRLSDFAREASAQLIKEIQSRLRFLREVGLSYLTLNRISGTLSGGESQRIMLAKSLGSSLVGSLYVLDEPSIGLHPRDTAQLIHVLKELRDIGNTVVVVEHDEDIMRAADYIIDIGPEAGRRGGRVVWSGTPEEAQGKGREQREVGGKAPASLQFDTHSYTLDFLSGIDHIPVPRYRRPWNNYIEVVGACENNLKNLNVRFPLNVMTCVTGVSGSGKSSLVSKVLYPALKKHYGGTAEHTGAFSGLQGTLDRLTDIEFVDQNPLSKSSRSNPVTYLKAYDEIRRLFAVQQLSKQMGFTAANFSFNTPGGRCETCQGEGTITVEMQFMADLILECEQCHGKRFNNDVLDVHFKGKSIYDVLEMTVNQAIEFFSSTPSSTERQEDSYSLSKEEQSICDKIVRRLKPLQDVGIGYIKLGQSSSTLSGGECQRVKLAYFLSQESSSPTMFVFDEPTTGLHYHDVAVLLRAMNNLIQKGHTVLIIEHHPAVIMAADHVIDLGPEGGDNGGRIVFEGTPEMLIKCKESYTGRFLTEDLKRQTAHV
ncbi:MAG: excinuclease ABC subunit UvrA [Paludibacteraceae bacterium]|nr:excinuclease ABC subunit UvrA [Paludibacteraceae bacterium]